MTLCRVVVVQIHVPTPASLAQSAEHQTFNLRVVGSSPTRGYSPRHDLNCLIRESSITANPHLWGGNTSTIIDWKITVRIRWHPKLF